jgi:hypothetical protein
VKIVPADGELNRLRRSVGTQEQRTFKTPLGELDSFVSSLLASDKSLESGSVLVAEVVFTPKHLEDLLARHDLPLTYDHEHSIVAENATEAASLLGAALADWVDFYFEPVPKHFLLYADHDEYATLFAPRKGPVSALAARLEAQGFAEVSGYVRQL